MRHSRFGRERERKKKQGADIYSYDMITDITVKLLQFSSNLKISSLHTGTSVGGGNVSICEKFWRIWDVIDDSSPKSIQKNNGQGINFVQFSHFVTPFITRSLSLCVFGVDWAERLLMVWFIRISKDGLSGLSRYDFIVCVIKPINLLLIRHNRHIKIWEVVTCNLANRTGMKSTKGITL